MNLRLGLELSQMYSTILISTPQNQQFYTPCKKENQKAFRFIIVSQLIERDGFLDSAFKLFAFHLKCRYLTFLFPCVELNGESRIHKPGKNAHDHHFSTFLYHP